MIHQPVITTNVQTVDGLFLPTLNVISDTYNFTLSCQFLQFINDNFATSPEDECNKYIKISTDIADGSYNAYFNPTLDLKTVPSLDATEGIMAATFRITTTDSNFDSNDFIYLMSKTSTKIDNGIINTDEINEIDPNLITSTFEIFYHQQTWINYSRNVKKLIKPSALADFDIYPKTISIPYLTTRLRGIGSLEHNDNMVNSSYFRAFIIQAENHSVRIEIEQR
ncbi:9268_t:CDS:2 [Paraglomus occultum]|uniref:9268_t:CDS:1 n=1 Tax=Paraglomus occultum TaxID=144539 RepID=A0A9N9B2H9_9GLOM|nr:9268_t:CDS:2 [Paraglomus occultum]